MRTAWKPVLFIALAPGIVLAVLSGRYGYHRDELYFHLVGQHPSWGYPDQPPLIPLYGALAGGSLVLMRLPSVLAFMAGAVLTALIAQEQGQRIWLCQGQRMPWSRLWPKLKNLS